ncbi:MAG TPA: ATP-binding cassette domain-containing protein, partial [Casimicrobiaceae bacterium]|nr:ATP-binding cassette domain-containing protein [Casimicrobiaceae bacterium]
MAELLTAQGLSKVFESERVPGGFSALHDVSLGVGANEFVSIVGPSGCGKSTLLSIIGGFEKPTAGRLLLDGKPIEGPSRERGFVFQADALFHWLTVEQNVAYGLRVQGYPREA